MSIKGLFEAVPTFHGFLSLEIGFNFASKYQERSGRISSALILFLKGILFNDSSVVRKATDGKANDFL